MSGLDLESAQNSVVMRTSYADNRVFPFTKVFKPPHNGEDTFQPLLPVVLDCINGVNGAIVVRVAHACFGWGLTDVFIVNALAARRTANAVSISPCWRAQQLILASFPAR